jgi:hypothetical protein
MRDMTHRIMKNGEAQNSREFHRELDNLGKFGIRIKIHPEKKMSRAKATDLTRSLLQGIADNCFAGGADLIGHIKCHFKTSSGNIRGSLVNPDLGVNVESDLSRDGIASMLGSIIAVVHGIWDSEVSDESMKAIAKVCKEYDSRFEILE